MNAVGQAAFQPVDNTYVSPNGPYLDKGLGGLGTGAAASLVLLLPKRITPAFEVSAAYLRREQSGRLVPGGQSTGTLMDVLASALFGTANRGGTLRWRAGASWLGGPRVHGVGIYEGAHLGLTTGFDVVTRLRSGSRTSLLTSVRYSIVQRSQAATELGIGQHILRVGLGIERRSVN